MDAIKVGIRVRPLLDREMERGSQWTVSKDSLVQTGSSGSVYQFDSVFGIGSQTAQIYQALVEPIVTSVMKGFNGTIFAYGQTSSGKTHTMTGNSDDPGIIPLSILGMFQYIENDVEHEYLVRVSFLEIYNETLIDLLAPDNKKIKIREDYEHVVKVVGITEYTVVDPVEIGKLLQYGTQNRSVGETQMNERSSRSHTIFTLNVESRHSSSAEDDAVVKVAALNLVDLAGSERVRSTGSEGVRFKEGTYINLSLLGLGNVISKLSEGKNLHIPFRDSKLTRILQSSLGGNAKTCMICSITPAEVSESHSTLRFASRAMTVKNKPIVNEVLVGEEALLKRLKEMEKENEKLRVRLGEGVPQQEQQELADQLAKTENEKLSLENRLKTLENIIVSTASLAHIEKTSSQGHQSRRKTVCGPGFFSHSEDTFPSSPLIATTKKRSKKVTFDCPDTEFKPHFSSNTFEMHLQDIQSCLSPKHTQAITPTLRGRASFIPTVISTPLNFTEDSLESHSSTQVHMHFTPRSHRRQRNRQLRPFDGPARDSSGFDSMVTSFQTDDQQAPPLHDGSESDYHLPLCSEATPPSLVSVEVQTDPLEDPVPPPKGPAYPATPTPFLVSAEVQTDPLHFEDPISKMQADSPESPIPPPKDYAHPVTPSSLHVQVDPATPPKDPLLQADPATPPNDQAEPATPPKDQAEPATPQKDPSLQTDPATPQNDPSLLADPATPQNDPSLLADPATPPKETTPSSLLVSTETQTDPAPPPTDPAPPILLVSAEVQTHPDPFPSSYLASPPSLTLTEVHIASIDLATPLVLVSTEVQTDTPSFTSVEAISAPPLPTTGRFRTNPPSPLISDQHGCTALNTSLHCVHSKQADEIISTMQFEADETCLEVEELKRRLKEAERTLAEKQTDIGAKEKRLLDMELAGQAQEELLVELQDKLHLSTTNLQTQIISCEAGEQEVKELKEQLDVVNKELALLQSHSEDVDLSLKGMELETGGIRKGMMQLIHTLQPGKHFPNIATPKLRSRLEYTTPLKTTSHDVMARESELVVSGEDSQAEMEKLKAFNEGQVLRCQQLEQELEQKNSAIEESSLKLEELSNELKALQEENDRISSLHMKTQDELMHTEQNEEMNKKVEELKTELEQKNSAIEESSLKLEELSNELKALQEENDRISSLHMKTQDELMHAEWNEEEMSKKVEELETKLEQKNSAIEESSPKLEELSNELKALQEENDRISSLHMKTQDELMHAEWNEEEMSKKVEELKTELEQKNSAIEESSLKLEELSNELKALQEENDHFSSLHIKTQDELMHAEEEMIKKVEELETDLEQKNSAIEESSLKLEELSNELKALQEENDRISSLHMKTQDELMHAEWNEEEMSKKVEELEAELEQKNSAIEESSPKLEELSNELKALQEENDCISSLHIKTQDELMHTEQNEEMSKKVEELKTELEQKNSAIEESSLKLEEFSIELKALQEENDRISSLHMKTQDELMHAEWNEEEMSRKVEELEAELEQKNSAIEESSPKLEELSNELKTLQEENDRISSLHIKTQDELMHAEWNEEEMSKKVEELETELEQKNSAIEESSLKLEELSNELKALQEENDRISSLHMKTQDELMHAEWNEEEMSKKVEELETKLEQKNSAIEESSPKLEELSNELKALQEENDRISSLHMKTQDELMHAEWNEEEMSKKVEELESELKEMREFHSKNIQHQNVSSSEVVHLRQQLLSTKKEWKLSVEMGQAQDEALKSLKEEHGKIVIQYAKIQDDMMKAENDSECKIAQLERELKDVKKSYEVAQAKITKLHQLPQGNAAKLMTENQELRDTVSAVRRDNSTLTRNLQGLATHTLPKISRCSVADGGSGSITGLAYYNIQQQLITVCAEKEKSQQKVEKMEKEREYFKRIKHERDLYRTKYTAVKEACSCGAVEKIKSGVLQSSATNTCSMNYSKESSMHMEDRPSASVKRKVPAKEQVPPKFSWNQTLESTKSQDNKSQDNKQDCKTQ